MFGISGEHLLVLLVILLFFGPRRLPELGNSLGRTLKNFRDAMNGKDTISPQQDHSQRVTQQASPQIPPASKIDAETTQGQKVNS